MTAVSLLLVFVGSWGAILWWLFAIRPYVRRHHQGYKTGANLLVAIWVDWQSCAEIARENDDRRGRRLSRVFVFLQLCFVLGLILGLVEIW